MTPVRHHPAVVAARSVVFHVLSKAVTVAFLLLFPLYWLPIPIVWAIIGLFVRSQLGLLWLICGQGYRVEGMENVPDGPCIFASRHEAMWETMFLPWLLDNPAVILKDELMRAPFVGTLSRRLGYIGVDRSGSPARAKLSFETARAEAAKGRRILIFPSGTRDPDQRYRVQRGVAVLYRALKLPCVPVVLDSGDYWPRKSWLRRPGTITVRILPPIAEGLRVDVFLQQLERDMARPAGAPRVGVETEPD